MPDETEENKKDCVQSRGTLHPQTEQTSPQADPVGTANESSPKTCRSGNPMNLELSQGQLAGAVVIICMVIILIATYILPIMEGANAEHNRADEATNRRMSGK